MIGRCARWILLAAAAATLYAISINRGEFNRRALVFVAVAGALAAAAIGSAPKRASAGNPFGLHRQFALLVAIVVFVASALSNVMTTSGNVIDVFTVQKEAVAAFLHGTNPYTLTHPNIYNNLDFYSPGMVVNGQVQMGYAYLPLTLFFSIPGYLAGDLRYSYLVAMILSALCLAEARRDWFGVLAAAFLLLNPVTNFILVRAWTEPLVILGVASTVYAAVRKPRWLPVAFGAFLATKQYSVLAIPLAVMLLPRFTWNAYLKLMAQAMAVAAVITLPLALWNLPHFVHDTVWWQLALPFRRDALSFAVLFRPLPLAVVLLGVTVAVGWCVARGPRRPAMFAASLGFVLLVFVAINKQAFANYYFLVAGCFCTAAAAEAAPANSGNAAATSS